jgi:putative ABC transport system permease protein
MTATLATPPPVIEARPAGAPARRAVLRWAWRLFRREWRQQILLLQLLALAVAVTILGAGVATNTPPPPAAGFGTADHLVEVHGAGLAAEVARLRQHFGATDVIEEQPLVTGTAAGSVLRAQDPSGPYASGLLTLTAGRYPAGSSEVALTSSLAGTLGLGVGGLWHGPGSDRRVVGLVENPQNLLDDFALVPPGSLTAPAVATVLFDASDTTVASYRFPAGEKAETPPVNSGIDPTLIVLSAAIFGLVFVGLVAVAGFSVVAQRRTRALGMLSALGATGRHLRLVMLANGAVVGLVAAIAGLVIGLAAWLGYRPRLETVAHHRIAWTALPWWLVASAVVLAVLTTVLAAGRPARAVARMPIVAALASRPAGPRSAHRSAIPGIVVLAAGLVMMAFSGGWGNGQQSSTGLQLGGLLGTSIGLLLVAPACVAVLGVLARHAPAVARLALRDLSRYRARSGAALAAVSFAVFIAMIVGLLASGRFADAVDYAGPNLSGNEMLVRAADADPANTGPANTGPVNAGPVNAGPVNAGPTSGSTGQSAPTAAGPGDAAAKQSAASVISRQVGASTVLDLESTDATLLQGFRGDPGVIYVATPALLRHYGIDPATIAPGADLLTSRSGLDGLTGLHVMAGDPDHPNDLLNPKIQRLSELPAGASEPNLLLTEKGVAALKAQSQPGGWLITAGHSLNAGQINAARQTAVGADLTIETKSDTPSLAQLRSGATVAGILLALAVLAMTVGLIRSETARDLITLTAVGAARRTRRALTSITAATLGFLGAVLGTAAAYLLTIALFRSQLSEKLTVPYADLIAILIGLPLTAAVLSWLLAAREPRSAGRTPLD